MKYGGNSGDVEFVRIAVIEDFVWENGILLMKYPPNLLYFVLTVQNAVMRCQERKKNYQKVLKNT